MVSVNAGSLAPRVARTAPSVKWPHERCQQRCQTGSGCAEVGGFEGASRQFVDANIKKSEAGDRVQKLQQALDMLGDTEGPEVDELPVH